MQPFISKIVNGKTIGLTNAKKCIWCGKTYDEHEENYPNRPKPRVPCLLLKKNFKD